ncbi:hypothetical protein [Kitasatospora sp. MAP5-34]|uniref:hypothetical protein n=1 Tax=Kitasatospora sp. MAP5-34 TaxID=3035102 RepID=UPI0024733DDB|nr:hypothetical protein [Kitasatospora sp. MAP5-34]MDH6574656.1 indoleamine 2,3-dioxygenase [Kitasatospora sp. MAP5-34]
MARDSTLDEFGLDRVRGFLPVEDPLRALPAGYAAWEEANIVLPGLLLAGRAREHLDRLPELGTEELQGPRQVWRGFLLVSVLANAYIMGGTEQAAVLPRALAVPLHRLAERLDVAPVFNYAAIVLRNWSRIDPSGPVELGNITPLCSFLGGVDEGWFLMSMTAIEAKGGPVPAALLEISRAVAAGDHAAAEKGLATTASCLAAMTDTFARLSEKCDPYIFYHRVRPILDAWQQPGVIYEGVSAEPQMWTAASAAQCALIQALDAAFGIRHSGHGGEFLRSMRRYMPTGHRVFIERFERGPSLRDHVEGTGAPALRDAYNENVHLLSTLRRQHMEISVRYIAQQARDQGGTRYGTSGTDFIQLLHAVRRETTDSGI